MNSSFPGTGFGFGDGGSAKGGGPGSANDLWDTLGQLRQSLEQTMGPFGQTLGQTFGQAFGQKVGSRVGRGDVRAAILSLLAEKPMHGYQIIQQIEERSGGSWKPSPGSVYPTLQLLTDEGLIDVEESSGRKTYSLTEEGRAAAEDADRPWPTREGGESAPTHGGPWHSALPKAGANLAQAAMQVGRTGSPEQIDEAVAVIDEARRKLYAILAQG
ncbi:MAG: PadR family transcriptional regulator [Microbacterium sp.]|nr:MAG: PadR family transcriptional regulator [Microbacterium sp.]